jgi:hypothetical protein
MNPVSIRGRSMPRDRRAFKALLATTTLLCVSLTAGCLRSTMLRPTDGPLPPQSPPSSAPTPVTPPVAPSASNPPQSGDLASSPVNGPQARPTPTLPSRSTPLPLGEPRAGSAPQQIQSASDSSGQRPDAVTPAIAQPISENPAANPTPLLDAAIERVTAVVRQDASEDSEAADSVSQDAPPRADSPGPPTASQSVPPVQASNGPPPAVAPVSSAPFGRSRVKDDDPPAATDVTSSPQAETLTIHAENPPKSDTVAPSGSATSSMDTVPQSDERAHAEIDVTKSEPVIAEPDPLEINKLTLCRKVLGFGSFETLPDIQVKASQRLLVYCELTGMQYEEKGSEFVSRLSSRIEIASVANGTTVWMQELGPAEDVCGSRRHDYYVNYRVDLPSSLPSGLYSLRLTQNDLIAHRSASAEIPVEIVP